MQRLIMRLFKCVSCLGLVNGLTVYCYYLYHRLVPGKRWVKRRLAVRSVSRPIWLRPGVSDWFVLERIVFDREYDPSSDAHNNALCRLEAKILAAQKKPLIVDCGANIGLSAIWFSERFPHSRILAIEPEQRNFDILVMNAAMFENIVPINAALSRSVSRVTLVNDRNTPWSWQTVEDKTGGTESVTIPSLLSAYDDHELFVVKMDIEGFETVVLEGNTEWIDDLPAMIFEMHDWMHPWSGSGHAFFSLLTRRKRDYLIKGENVFAFLTSALSQC